MLFYHTCPHCDAALDPGEKCDCQAGKTEAGKTEMVFATAPLMGDLDCRVDPVEVFALSY